LWLNLTWATISPERRILNIKKTNGEIIIDGVLDEVDWNGIESANNFQQHFPMILYWPKARPKLRSPTMLNIYISLQFVTVKKRVSM